MPYADLNTVHNPAPGLAAPAAWGDQVRDNEDFLANPPSCRVYNTANLSIPNNAQTALTFNAERWDSDTMHSTATNPSRIAFTTAGLYRVDLTAMFASNPTGFREAYIRLNGTTFIARANGNAVNGAVTAFAFGTAYRFAAGDYVEAVVYQNSGGALNVLSLGNESPEFSAVWLGL